MAAGEDKAAMQDALLSWYGDHARSYPWRETTDPYAILVCEIMSQQTQLDRVLDPWEAFLERWPNVEALAATSQASVVAFWSEHRLGYNNRAKWLHQAATQIIEEFDGDIPTTPAGLEELTGVGPYTASAVAAFAFNTDTAVVDTNVRRVLYRAFDCEDDDEAVNALARSLLPSGEARTWNNAIMELGAVGCQKTPKCDEISCPWRASCHAYETGDFTAPDVPTQPSFEGSRRQFRGRIVRALADGEEMTLEDLGPKIRVDYTPGGEDGRQWLRGVLEDLQSEGLLTLSETNDTLTVQLRE